MIIVINKYVESWKSWKLFEGKKKLRGWNMVRLTWKMNNICEEAVTVAPFDLGPWTFIIGCRWYNPNYMCLSILYLFFHFTPFWIELKNANKIFKQLHHCFKRFKKDEVPCWLNDNKKLASCTFSCYMSLSCHFHMLFFLIRHHVLLKLSV